MGSKTKIIVLHMKEILYTAVFLVLGILLVILLVFMFRPDAKSKSTAATVQQYTPGVYSSTLTLNGTALEVEVSVDEAHINSIRFANLDETVTTMFPLLQPAIEDIAEQVYDAQSLEGIALSNENPYTSQIILDAIKEAVVKAATD